MPWAASVMARSWPATSWIRGRLVVAVPPAAEAPLAVEALVTVTGAGVSLVAVALVAVRALPVVAPRGRGKRRDAIPVAGSVPVSGRARGKPAPASRRGDGVGHRAAEPFFHGRPPPRRTAPVHDCVGSRLPDSPDLAAESIRSPINY